MKKLLFIFIVTLMATGCSETSNKDISLRFETLATYQTSVVDSNSVTYLLKDTVTGHCHLWVILYQKPQMKDIECPIEKPLSLNSKF